MLDGNIVLSIIRDEATQCCSEREDLRMERKVLLGKVVIDQDIEMHNMDFEYAASFEDLLVKRGEYPIYTYESSLKEDGGKIRLTGYRNYFGYEGTVLASNVGGKKGEHTTYTPSTYAFMLAEMFVQGHDAYFKKEYVLRPEWEIEIEDYISSCDDKRHFMFNIVLKDRTVPTYDI